jgi:hypothetical protein
MQRVVQMQATGFSGREGCEQSGASHHCPGGSDIWLNTYDAYMHGGLLGDMTLTREKEG